MAWRRIRDEEPYILRIFCPCGHHGSIHYRDLPQNLTWPEIKTRYVFKCMVCQTKIFDPRVTKNTINVPRGGYPDFLNDK